MRFPICSQLALALLLGASLSLHAADEKRTRSDQYGDPLPPGAVARLGTTRLRNSHCLAFSPDGKALATAGRQFIRLWDLATGKEIRRLSVPRSLGTARALAYSPDGRKIAAVDHNGIRLAVWKVDQTKPLFSRTVNDLGLHLRTRRITFSPDSKTLYTGNAEAVYRWDASTGRQIYRFQHGTEDDPIETVIFSRDGKYFATANSGSPKLRVWNTQPGRLLHVLRRPGDLGYLCAAFRPDGRLLATGDNSDNSTPAIRLWDVKSGKEVRKLEAEVKACELDFTPVGDGLAACRDGFCLWDLRANAQTPRVTLAGWVGESVWAFPMLACSPDGKTLACISYDQSVRLLDTATSKERLPFASHRGQLNVVAFAPNGKLIATASDDETIRFWEAGTGKPKGILRVQGGWVKILAFSPDGRWLVSESDETITLWKADKQTRHLTIKTRDRVKVLAFAPDSKTLLLGSPAGGIHFWDVQTGKKIRGIKESYKDDRWFASLVISPNGNLFALGREHSFHIYDARTCKLLRTVKTDQGIVCLAFSPDSRTLACGGTEQLILWEVAAGKERLRVPRDWGAFSSLVYSPDGRLLASGWYDPEADPIRSACVWELATGKELGAFVGHEERVNSLAFSPDGKQLATASEDTTVLIWDLAAVARRGPHPVLEKWPSRALRTARDLEVAWMDLAGVDAIKAQTALWALTITPQLSVPFLREHLHPVATPEPGRITALIADLDNDHFEVREKASTELARLGTLAEKSLRQKLLDRPTLEVRRRITALLAKLPVLEIHSAEELRAVRAVEALEQMGTPEAIRLLRTLATGAKGARLTQEAKASLERLSRRSRP